MWEAANVTQLNFEDCVRGIETGDVQVLGRRGRLWTKGGVAKGARQDHRSRTSHADEATEGALLPQAGDHQRHHHPAGRTQTAMHVARFLVQPMQRRAGRSSARRIFHSAQQLLQKGLPLQEFRVTLFTQTHADVQLADCQTAGKSRRWPGLILREFYFLIFYKNF